MPKARPELLFINILISIDKIRRNIKDLPYVDFVTDEKTFALVTREMQEIGESAKKLKNTPGSWHQLGIEWQDVVDFRNIVVHRYFGINPEIIFDTAITEIPELEKSVLNLLKQSSEKKYILEAITGLRNVFDKIKRQETVCYLNSLANLIK
ncbi:DUF86 domain-containing protein [Candidatus Dependentiae bacterium]|nr:DUF86 domain-containing protein [Candidatus Dependentiae bacterium]